MGKNIKNSQLGDLYTDNHMEEAQRDQTGSFYTPYEMARWMVWKALPPLLKGGGKTSSDEWEALLNGLVPQAYKNSNARICNQSMVEIWKQLILLKVADIASGTGVFLMAWLDLLSDVGRQVQELGEISENERLEGLKLAAAGVWAVDIHGDALTTFRRLVMELYGLDGVHTWTTNALKDEFTSNQQMAAVLASGGFDLILGNPPYIGEKGNRAIFDDIKSTELYQHFYVAKMDYWYFFLHRAQGLLKPEGVLAYLVSSYFVTADGATKLRSELQKMTLHTLVDFTDNSLFKAAKGHHSMALFLSPVASHLDAEIIQVAKSKGMKEADFYKSLYNKNLYKGLEVQTSIKCNKKPQRLLYLENGYMSLMEEHEDGVYKRLVGQCQWTLGELCHINQGIVSGLDSSRVDGKGVFVLDDSAAVPFAIESVEGIVKSFYKNSDIDAYWTASASSKRLLYIDGLETDFELHYPEMLNHLSPHRPVLEKRRECQSGKRPWYALQWPRKNQVFEGPKLVVPHRASRNRFAFTDQPFHGSADIYYISIQKRILEGVLNQVSSCEGSQGIDEKTLLLYLMALLNSRVYNFLLVKSGKKKGAVLELYATPLKKLPVYLPAEAEIVKIAEMANGASRARVEQSLEKYDRIVDQIESAICKLYNIMPEDRAIIETVVKSWRKEDGLATKRVR